MIINFNCKTLENNIIPFSVWMLQVPFEPESPQYYVATLYSKDKEEIASFYEINPNLCFDKIKNILRGYHYKIQDITHSNGLEPASVFAQILVDFAQ